MEYTVPRRLNRVLTKKQVQKRLVAETEGKKKLWKQSVQMWEFIICHEAVFYSIQYVVGTLVTRFLFTFLRRPVTTTEAVIPFSVYLCSTTSNIKKVHLTTRNICVFRIILNQTIFSLFFDCIKQMIFEQQNVCLV